MRNPALATTKGLRTMEASLQKFGKRIKKNMAADQAGLKTGAVGRYQYTNPLRKPDDEVTARAKAVAMRTKKK